MNMNRLNIRKMIPMLARLGKLKLSVMVTLSATTGYILASGSITVQAVLPVLGILMLSLGASALNQVQEKNIDALMERTRHRPVPSRQISPGAAFLTAITGIISGLYLTGICTGTPGVILGILAVVWYNGLYTYLKRITAFAVIPGSFVGVIPPVIGWIAGGGSLFELRISVLMLFFFMWQVPHFWILVLMYGEEYENAGLPSLTKVFSGPQLSRITFIWLLATAETCLLIMLFGFVRSQLIQICVLVATVWLVIKAFQFLRAGNDIFGFQRAYRGVNQYVVVTLVLLSTDAMINLY